MTEQQRIEELMKPRFKAIADYPLSKFKIGDVFEYDSVWVEKLENYPHLFKRLEWWEDRDLSALPMYVRFGEFDKAHAIYKIIEWNPEALADCSQEFNPCGYAERPTEYFISLRFPNNYPATLTEYTQYINSKQ